MKKIFLVKATDGEQEKEFKMQCGKGFEIDQARKTAENLFYHSDIRVLSINQQ